MSEAEGKKKKPNYGHSVSNGKINYSSVSQIKMFDPKDDGCPAKWAYSYMFGIKLDKTKAQTGGSSLGELTEHYLTTGEDVLPDVLQRAKKFFPNPFNKDGVLDLECEQPLGPDLGKAIELRKMLLAEPNKFPGDWPKLIQEEIRKF